MFQLCLAGFVEVVLYLGSTVYRRQLRKGEYERRKCFDLVVSIVTRGLIRGTMEEVKL